MRLLAVCLLVACSGKSRDSAPVEDARRMAIADAAVDLVVDAPEPFDVVARDESAGGEVVTVRPRGAACPSVEWRARGRTVRLERCKDRPLAEQTDQLRDLVAHLRGLQGAMFEDVRVVGWGDYYSYPELARRLAQHAQKVPYDPAKGLHAYIKEAAVTADLAPELAVIFQRKPRLVDVEKCSSGRPSGRGEIAQWLRAQGFTGNRELPVGCALAIFELVR